VKYWLLTTEYPPQYGGGIGTYVHCTAAMLSKKGHDVTVFIYDISLLNDKITFEQNVRVIRFVPNRTGTSKFLGFQANISYEYAAIVGAYIRSEGRPAIIESQEYLGIAYYLQQYKWMRYKEFADLTILITCHAPSFLYLEYNHVPIYAFPQFWTGEMEKSSMLCADLLISPSTYLVKEIQDRMQRKIGKVQYVRNPVSRGSNSRSTTYSKNYIVCFGKLSPLKGTFALLKYFKELWDKGFEHPLHLVGNTDLLFHPEGKSMGDVVKDTYKDYINRQLLVLEGEHPPANLGNFLEKAHLVIVPSLVDNLPYTVLEAMALGKIVLASKQGGQSEVIRHGVNGFLFDHHEPGDFETQLIQILSMGPAALEQISERACQTMNTDFAPDTVYTKKMDVINEFMTVQRVHSDYPFTSVNSRLADDEHESKSGKHLSVVIPYFNMGDYIEECVRSVINTDVEGTEIIIVNDGSTQAASLSALSAIEKKFPVKIVHTKNQGLALARNYGAGIATGQFIAFLDPDDTVDTSFYPKAITLLSAYTNVHFVSCWANYTGHATGCWPAFNPEPPLLLFHNLLTSTLVFRKSSFLSHGKFDPGFEYGMEDWDAVVSMIENSYGGLVLPEPLFNYRVRKKSMARNFTVVKRLFLHQLMADKHKKIYQQYGPKLVHLFNANGSGLFIDNPTKQGAGISTGIFSLLSGKLQGRLKEKIKGKRYLRKIAYIIFKRLK